MAVRTFTHCDYILMSAVPWLLCNFTSYSIICCFAYIVQDTLTHHPDVHIRYKKRDNIFACVFILSSLVLQFLALA